MELHCAVKEAAQNVKQVQGQLAWARDKMDRKTRRISAGESPRLAFPLELEGFDIIRQTTSVRPRGGAFRGVLGLFAGVWGLLQGS